MIYFNSDKFGFEHMNSCVLKFFSMKYKNMKENGTQFFIES